MALPSKGKIYLSCTTKDSRKNNVVRRSARPTTPDTLRHGHAKRSARKHVDLVRELRTNSIGAKKLTRSHYDPFKFKATAE